jgi:hypothetical protein
MNDRNAKYSTSTCLVCVFLGFTLGFIACHLTYKGIDRNNTIFDLQIKD